MLLGDRDPKQPEIPHGGDDSTRALVGVLEVRRHRHDVALDEAAHRRDEPSRTAGSVTMRNLPRKGMGWAAGTVVGLMGMAMRPRR